MINLRVLIVNRYNYIHYLQFVILIQVEQLKKERDAKQNQLDILKSKSPQDLWKEDLEEFMISWKEMDAKKAEDSSSGKGKKPTKSSPKKRNVKKPAPPAKVILLEDSDKDYTPEVSR